MDIRYETYKGIEIGVHRDGWVHFKMDTPPNIPPDEGSILCNPERSADAKFAAMRRVIDKDA